MKQVAIIVVNLMIYNFSFSQAIHFKVVDIKTLKTMQGVEVVSSLVPKDVLKTDKGGNVFVNHLDNDTITFTKLFYYPVKLHIRHQAYDFNHVVEVVMVPSIQKSHEFDKNNLQAFEYHFIHDTLGNDSHLKVTAFEHADANVVRSQWNEKSFRFTHIDLRGKDEKSTGSYSLKKEDE